MTAMPTQLECQRARMARDWRYDGRFFIGVLTTGVFCRPICPARMPMEENVRYYASAAAAQEAGYRPCRRCRPENAARVPEWTLGHDTVIRALRRIDAGYLNDRKVSDLAASLALSTRQLNRLFQEKLSATPAQLARMQRLRVARELVERSQMPMTQVAHHSGFGSVRRFNDEFRAVFQCAPSQLRKANNSAHAQLCFKLPVREPYDRQWVLDFLTLRALGGVEEVVDDQYRRRILDTNGQSQWLTARFVDASLEVQMPISPAESVASLLRRVRRVFDLDSDGAAIHAGLSEDECLGEWARRAPGLRVPGAWDGFETAVRAVLGQQVSVPRAAVLANAMIDRYGGGNFPTPEQLSDADVAELGMPGARGAAIRELARQVGEGEISLDECQDSDALTEQLCAIKGIGPWTAGYVSMRVAKHPDAFLPSDWVVLKVLNTTAPRAAKLSERWRPWRAYAVMLLWYASSQLKEQKR